MTDRMRVLIEAVDEASDDLKRIAAEARRMGGEVERGGREAERGFRGVGRSAEETKKQVTQVGAAIGALVGGMALLGRNAREHEQDIRSLEVAYGDSADEIIAFSEALQDSTNFSNDAAREAALIASTLTREYGLTADQVQQLIAVSADLAAVHRIDLVDAVRRTEAAIRGESESAERLGLSLSQTVVNTEAAARGLDSTAFATDLASAAQFRFQLLLEQSNYAMGQSGVAAQGAAGRGADFRDWLDDTAESAGRALGPMGEFLSISGDLALAAPLAGAGVARLAAGIGALSGLLGPVGLVGAGLAAAGAIAYLTLRHEDQEVAVANADEATKDLIDTLNRLALAGQSTTDQFLNLEAWNRQLEAIIVLQSRAEEIGARIRQNAFDAAVAAGGPTGAGERAIDLYEDAVARFVLTQEEAVRVGTLLTQVVNYQGVAFEAASRYIDEAFADYERGRIDVEGLIRRLEQVDDVAAAAAAAQAEAAATATLAAEAYRQLGDGVGVATVAIEGGHDTLLDYIDAQQTQTQATELQTAALDAQAAEQERLAPIIEAVAAAQRAHTTEAIANAQAQRDAEQAAYATAAAITGTIAPLDEAVASMGAVRAGSLLTADGLLTLADQQLFAAATAADLGRAQDELSGQIGFYRGALGQMEDAYGILQARIEAGETLNQRELEFYREYEAAASGATRTLDDLRVEQGILAQAQLDNVEAQTTLAGKLDDTNETFGDLADQIERVADALIELFGLDVPDLAPPERTAILWSETARAIAQTRDALAGVVLPESQRGQATGGSILSGFAVNPPPSGLFPAAAPANVPPPSQALLDPQMVIPVTAEVVRLSFDHSSLEAAVVATEAFLDARIGEHFVFIQADGDEAFAVIKDLEGDVRAIVTEDHVVFLEGNADGALSEVDAVALALGAIDGNSATVYAYADASQARNTLDGLTGFQGNAYVNVYAIPQGGGPTDVTRREGGAIAAAYGRMVTLAEAGPEWVDTPHGGFLAAQHGRYILPGGSYVHPAPATRDIVGRGPTIVNHFHGVSRRDVPQITEAVRSGVSRAMTAFGR